MKLIILSGLLTCIPGYAGNIGDIQNNHNIPYVTTLSIGPTWTNPGSQQTIYMTPQLFKMYTAYKPNNTLADGEVFLGLRHELPYAVSTHIGVAGALTSQAGLSGEILDFADPMFNNHVYGYKIQHSHVALKGKIFKDIGYKVLPWLSGSIGVGFNRAHGFYNFSIVEGAVAQNNFGTHTQKSLTYTLGAGIQQILRNHWQAGIGYEFADWGKSKLTRAFQQTVGNGLALNHVYTNGIMFNLTYIA